jgi:SAM-dependent methyltransferase
MRPDWHLKLGYQARLRPQYFVDELIERGSIHQPDVYPFAAHLADRWGCDTILDIGCGRAGKLAPLHERFHVIGIDIGENLEYCRRTHAFGEWIERDLEVPGELPIPSEVLSRSLIVCADVIEHLVDPSPLLYELKRLLEHAPMALVSTPERDRARGIDDLGPPGNPHHVREWNRLEFGSLLGSVPIRVPFLGLTRSTSLDGPANTILALCESSSAPGTEPVRPSFRVLAIMASYNEEDIIVPAIRTLLEQGVEVHLMDNGSTDATVRRTKEAFGGTVPIERFPQTGPADRYDWTGILRRKEQIAAQSGADWCLHHDADAIRRPPWPNLDLREALWRVDRQGFSAVDHTLLDFRPVDETWGTGSSSLEDHFRYFEWGLRPGQQLQIKAWKNLGPVDLAETGGHEARFQGRRVYPLNFLLKHYPIRSSRQARSKIDSRRERVTASERQRGWHTQYDQLAGAHTFRWSPEGLSHFDRDRFEVELLTERLARIGRVFSGDGSRAEP